MTSINKKIEFLIILLCSLLIHLIKNGESIKR